MKSSLIEQFIHVKSNEGVGFSASSYTDQCN